MCTSTCKQVIKPQTDCRRVFKTRRPELGCCDDCSHAHDHVQPGLQRYSQWIPSYQAKRYGSNGPSRPEGYLTEKLQALRISPDYMHQPFTPQGNSLQHFQTQGVFQSCSHDSRRPDHSKLQAKKALSALYSRPKPSRLIKQRTCHSPARMSTPSLSSEPKAKSKTQIRLLTPTLP